MKYFDTVNPMKKLLVALALTLTAPVAALADTFTAGKDYQVIASPVPVEKPGMIEVREFFWYGCPHCFRLDPYIQNWLKTKPKDVNFVRTPASLNPVWEANARGFYALEQIGGNDLIEKTHATLFNTIHEKQVRIFDENSLANFSQQFGVDPAKFHGLFNSFVVTSKVNYSRSLAQKLQIDGVPALIVNGKYRVSGEDDKALEKVNFLIAKERGGK